MSFAETLSIKLTAVAVTILILLSLPVEAKSKKHADRDDRGCVRIESTSNVAWGVTADHAENRAREKAIEAWMADVFKQRGAESMNMRGEPTFNYSQAGPSNKRRWTCRVSAVACRTS